MRTLVDERIATVFFVKNKNNEYAITQRGIHAHHTSDPDDVDVSTGSDIDVDNGDDNGGSGGDG